MKSSFAWRSKRSSYSLSIRLELRRAGTHLPFGHLPVGHLPCGNCHLRQLPFETVAIWDTCQSGHLPCEDTCHADRCHSRHLPFETLASRKQLPFETIHTTTYFFKCFQKLPPFLLENSNLFQGLIAI